MNTGIADTPQVEQWRKELGDRWNPDAGYLKRPVEWVRDKPEEFLWSKQREILESVRDNRYTAVHSAHDLGKSMVASRAITWWIDSHPVGSAFVVSTAPTAAQVSAILWREIGKTVDKAHLAGKVNRAGYPQWFIGNELVGYGRKPADYEDSAFQGIHARYVLIIIDEACGVAKQLFDAVDSLATNEFARVLAIGNPDDPGSHFANVCKPGSDWNVIHLDGLRSPNITKARVIGYKSAGYGYENPKYPLLAALMEAENIPYSTEKIPANLNDMLISELWIEERIRRWGGIAKDAHLNYSPDELRDIVRRRCAGSSLFSAKVRGIFPTEGTTGVIPIGWVTQAVNRWHDMMEERDRRIRDENNPNYPWSMLKNGAGRKIIGVDVAGEGEDETVIAVRYGSIILPLERYKMTDTIETADYAAAHMHEPGSMAVVDVIGIGSGVYDTLRKYKRDNTVLGNAIKFNASAATNKVDAIHEFRFRNDRSAAWWRMRELLDPARGANICLPDDERLIEELVAVQYKHLVGGIIAVEPKDEIRKRIGRSTDSADAVIQSCWIEGNPEPYETVEWQNKNGSGVVGYAGYDPFTDRDFGVSPGFNRPDTALDDWINS